MISNKVVAAEDVRRLRKLMRLTQKELAKKAGVSQSLIARIENNDIDPRLSTIRKIIDALIQIDEKRTASDLMHSPVITVDVKDSVRTAIEFMKRYSISQMPVLKGNKIIGSIKETTILSYIMRGTSLEKVFSDSIYNVMEKRFATVSPTTSVDDVIYLLSQGEAAVLVMDNERLIGIITKIDAIASTLSFKKMEDEC